MSKYYQVFNDPDSGDGEILIVHNESQETICIIPAKFEGNINRGWDREKADLVEKALEAFRPEWTHLILTKRESI